jgi:enoyl-CoA hydratase
MALVEIDRGTDGVAVVTLNRPEAMNALSRGLQDELSAAFEALDADDAIKVIVLTGAGERAFSAGLDLKEVAAYGMSMSPDGSPRPSGNALRAPAKVSKPTIGAINGVAITGGFELAVACDILIASTNARFADTHARVGVMAGAGLSQVLSRMIGPSRAKELSFTGNYIDAPTAAAWGLVNRVVEPAELMPAALKLARDIANIDSGFIKRYKALIDDGFALPFGEAMELEQTRAKAANAAVTADSVAARRAGIQARGRDQKG